MYTMVCCIYIVICWIFCACKAGISGDLFCSQVKLCVCKLHLTVLFLCLLDLLVSS